MKWTLENNSYQSGEYRIRKNKAGTYSLISIKKGFLTIADTVEEAKKKAEKFGGNK